MCQLGSSPIIMRLFLKIFVFSLNSSPLTMKQFGKIFVLFTWTGRPLQWHNFEKSLYFSPRQVTHYNEIIFKNPRMFHLGRLSITIWSFWKIFVFFHLGKLPITMWSFWKILVFFLWSCHQWKFNAFKKSLFFTRG